MINVYDRGGRTSEPYVATLIADTAADIDTIDVTLYNPGTACLVLDDSTVHMLNSEKEWVEL